MTILKLETPLDSHLAEYPFIHTHLKSSPIIPCSVRFTVQVFWQEGEQSRYGEGQGTGGGGRL